MNRSTQESLKKSLKNENEYDWVDMLPMIAFSHRTSMNASTRVSPLEMILGHKPNVPIDIHMKYPTEEDLDRDLTEEEVARLEREYLDNTIEEMKKVKETTIGRAKVNIANAQIRQKRNYDKRFESKEKFEIGDSVLLENQVNKNLKGGKRQNRFSGPYTILDISKAGNCTLKHKEGAIKKTKHPLAHLKQYHERNLVGESESDVEENKEDKCHEDEILDCFEKEEDLEFVDSLVTEENMEEKWQNEQKLDCKWNFAENVMGLVIKDKFKQKRKREDSSGTRKKVTYLDLSKCVASEEDTLPDINTEEFTGAQRNEEDIGDQRKDFTGAHLTGAHVTGALNDNKKEFFTDDDWIVTGAPSFMGTPSFTGAHEYGEVTGTPQENILQVTSVTGADSFTGAQCSVTGARKENMPVTGAPFTGAQYSVTGTRKENITVTGTHLQALIGMMCARHKTE